MPVFFSLIGGIIGYFILKRDDLEKAKQVLYVGIAVFVLSVFYSFVQFGVLFANQVSIVSPLSFLLD